MKVHVFYTGHDPELDQLIIREAGMQPVQVGDQIVDNPDLADQALVEKSNFRMPAHLNRHFLVFEMNDRAGEYFAAYLPASPDIALQVKLTDRKPTVCPTCGHDDGSHAHIEPEVEQDLAHVEDFVKTPDEGELPPAPRTPGEPRFMKLYPCGCTAGPGPENMPDYCPTHGTPEDTSGCKTVPFAEPGQAS